MSSLGLRLATVSAGDDVGGSAITDSGRTAAAERPTKTMQSLFIFK